MARSLALEPDGFDLDDGSETRPVEADGSPETTDAYEWSKTRVILWAFVGLMVARTWLPDLTNGFRLDENLTAWIVSDGFGDAVSRSWTHQGQSPLYFSLLWMWTQIAGSSVVAMRLPSVVAGLCAAWNLRRLGEDLDRSFTGNLAGFALLGFNTGFTDARPYSFLLLALVIAARFAHSWSTGSHRWSGLGWVVAAAVAIYMHPFAIYALLPQMLFVWRGIHAGRSVREVFGLLVLAMALVAPIVPQVLALRERSAGLVLVDLPDVFTFISGLVPVQIGSAALAGLVWCRRSRLDAKPRREAMVFAGLWATLPAFGLFAQSHLTGDSVFLEHYYSGGLPGVVLVGAFLVGKARRRGTAVVSIATFSLVALLLVGPTPSHDWRGALDVAFDQESVSQIWAMSAYIEANDASVFADGASGDYLNAPFRVVGADGPLYGLPLQLDSAPNAQYVEQLVANALDDELRVVIIQRNDKRYRGADQAGEALVGAGYRQIDAQFPAGLTVTVFDRNP